MEECHLNVFNVGISPSPGVSFWFCERTIPRHGTPCTWGTGQAPDHTAAPAGSHVGQCWGQGRNMSLLPCHCAGLTTRGGGGGGGGPACQIGGGEWWPGRAGEQDTLQTAGGQHHLVPDHSQAGGMHQTPESSVFSTRYNHK